MEIQTKSQKDITTHLLKLLLKKRLTIPNAGRVCVVYETLSHCWQEYKMAQPL